MNDRSKWPKLFLLRLLADGYLQGFVVVGRMQHSRGGAREVSFSEDTLIRVYVVVSCGNLDGGTIKTALSGYWLSGMEHPGVCICILDISAQLPIEGDII